MWPSRTQRLALAVILAGSIASAQSPAISKSPPQDGPSPYVWGAIEIKGRGDVQEITAYGGARYIDGRAGLDVRCDSALIVLDRQETFATLRSMQSRSGLPRRNPALPDARRAFGEELMRARLDSFLGTLGRGAETPRSIDLELEQFRSLYLEGDVTVVLHGVEVLHAESLYFSAIDDRIVLRGLTLRLRDIDAAGDPVQVTLRTDQLIRQNGRFVGRDVSVTTCPAGVPQFEILSGEVEIIERARAFEINLRENVLAFSQTRVLPLPNQSFFTDEQKPFPIKSASAGYSNREGVVSEIVVGSDFNKLGGSLHERLTGRPASEFRGDWQLGVGFNQARGFPVEGELRYGAEDLYQGQAIGFHLDDDGENIRDIRNDLDGTLIDNPNRNVVWTENRFQIAERTKLDVTVWDASDAAVWSEFYSTRYYTAERPETNFYATHAQDNWIATASARWNMAAFSYDDGRQLARQFTEELPFLTFDWYSQPIAYLPGETPVTLSTSTGIAQLRSNYDNTVTDGIDDQTLRLDQDVELAAPFRLGAFGVRPYVDARFTHFDNTVSGDSADRWALRAGIELGTRMSKTWEWLGDDSTGEALRHVMSPTVSFDHRFLVDVDPTDLHQFDEVDSIDEGARIRVGLLQRLQRRSTEADGTKDISELLWLDLAQYFAPFSDSDGDTRHVGLFEFEVLVRPQKLSENVELGIGSEGEHDWYEDELRTFNNFIEVKTADVVWTGEYRTDRTDRGRIGYGLQVPIRHRWRIGGYSLFDIDTRESVNYTARLTRDELNWRLILQLRYDNVSDDTSLTFQFEPKFGGVFGRRSADWSVGGYQYGNNRPLIY